MLIRMTRRQHDAICAEVGVRAAEILNRDLDYADRVRMVDVIAPYAAWERAKALMIDRYLTVTGGKKPTTTQTTMSAMRRIAVAQNAVMRHPALRRKQMLGLQQTWFPVWELPEPDMTTPGGRWFSPFPIEGCPFVVLGPVWEFGHLKARATKWSPEGVWPRDHWLADEANHIL